MSPGHVRRARLVLLATTVVALAAGCGDDGGEAAEDRAADASAAGPSSVPVEQLREGGYVVTFRHAATDSGVDTTDDLSDCSRQRNLDSAGRRQSREIGRAFERLDIAVGQVMASPFCRTRDTARLAFGRVQPTRALLSVEFFASPQEGRREGLRRLLRAEPRQGTNTVLVTHGSAILDALGEEPEEGDAVIVEPGRGKRGYAVVTTVPVDDWRSARPD
jgi:broad specificity phosphatase PhoE